MLSAVSRCKHAHTDNIVWWRRLELKEKDASHLLLAFNETERGAEAKHGDQHNQTKYLSYCVNGLNHTLVPGAL